MEPKVSLDTMNFLKYKKELKEHSDSTLTWTESMADIPSAVQGIQRQRFQKTDQTKYLSLSYFWL